MIYEVIKNQRDANFQIAIDDVKVAARACPSGTNLIDALVGLPILFSFFC